MNQGFNMLPLNLPKFQPPFAQYDPVTQHMDQLQLSQSQSPFGYRSSGMNPYPIVGGLNHISRDAVYTQWPSHSLMYAHTHDPFRHAVFQVRAIEKRCLDLCILNK